MAERLYVGKSAGKDDRCHGISTEANGFIKVSHQNDVSGLAVVGCDEFSKVVDKVSPRIRRGKTALSKKRNLLSSSSELASSARGKGNLVSAEDNKRAAVAAETFHA